MAGASAACRCMALETLAARPRRGTPGAAVSMPYLKVVEVGYSSSCVLWMSGGGGEAGSVSAACGTAPCLLASASSRRCCARVSTIFMYSSMGMTTVGFARGDGRNGWSTKSAQRQFRAPRGASSALCPVRPASCDSVLRARIFTWERSRFRAYMRVQSPTWLLRNVACAMSHAQQLAAKLQLCQGRRSRPVPTYSSILAVRRADSVDVRQAAQCGFAAF